MRWIWGLVVVVAGCNGNGSQAPAPDAAHGADGPPPFDGAPVDAAVDGAPPADGAPTDGGGPIDGGPPSVCASVLAPEMDPITPPPSLVWRRCGGYGSGGVLSVHAAQALGRAVIVTEAGDAVVVALPSMTEIESFTHASGPVSFAALTIDGDMLATVDDARGEVAIWVVDTKTLFRRFSRPPAWPSSPLLGEVAFSPDGQYVAVISAARVDVWDVVTGEALPISGRPEVGGGSRVAFAQGRSRLVIGRFAYFGNGPSAGWGEVDIVDTHDGGNAVRLDYEFHISLPYLAVSPLTGEIVAVASDVNAGGLVALFDTATGAPLPVAEMTGTPLALDVGATNIALREAGALTLRRRDGALRGSVPAIGAGPWAAHLGIGGFALVGDVGGVTAVQFTDGVTTGTACTVGALEAYDTLTGIALSSDEATLVTTRSEGARQVWNVATGALEATAPPAGLIAPSATSPDGRFVAIADALSTFHVEEVATGELVATYGPHPTRVTGLDWGGPTRIASTGEREPADRWTYEPSVKVWDTTLGALEQTLPGVDNGPALFDVAAGSLFVTGRSHVTRWCR